MSSNITTKQFAIEKNVYIKYISLYTLSRYVYIVIPCIILIILGIIFKIKYLYIITNIFLVVFICYFILKICIIAYSSIGNTLFDKYSYQIKQNALYLVHEQKHFLLSKNDKSVIMKKYKNKYIFIVDNWYLFYIDETKFKSKLEFKVFEGFVKNHFSIQGKNKNI